MDWRWIGEPERAAMRVKGAEDVFVARRATLGVRKVVWRSLLRATGRRERTIAVIACIMGELQGCLL